VRLSAADTLHPVVGRIHQERMAAGAENRIAIAGSADYLLAVGEAFVAP
jgi:hypothetical protein